MKSKHRLAAMGLAALGALPLMFAAPAVFADTQQWSAEKAQGWYASQRWLVGSDYIPADAINQLEMWQAETWNPAQIDKELGWADGIGMNTMRVFLHDQLWTQDPAGFRKRIDEFLTIAARHRIKPLLVLFDSCWEPYPKLGPQHPPIPGVHNSGWVQGPGLAALADVANYPRLRAYVTGVVGAFKDDPRILGWDVWNEPDNGSNGADDKFRQVAGLLPQVFAWARAADPSQPLTAGVWHDDDWSKGARLNAIEKVELEQSDIVSFHVYDWPEVLERRIKQLQSYGRPLLCTEYLARGAGSTFDTSLPVARKYGVGMINWGFVLGKTQTNFPWDSWQHPYTRDPPATWHHDIFHADGKPYRQAEVDLIRNYADAAQREFAKKK
jgi:hypothetical protein